jgi:hypothetical protein
MSICAFLYLHKLIARERERNRIGFDSTDIVCACVLLCISVHDYYEMFIYTLEYLPRGSVKVDYYLYICILLLFIHLISACSYSFSLNLHDNTFRNKRKRILDLSPLSSHTYIYTLIEMQSGIHSFTHFFCVVCNRINTKQKKYK